MAELYPERFEVKICIHSHYMPSNGIQCVCVEGGGGGAGVSGSNTED